MTAATYRMLCIICIVQFLVLRPPCALAVDPAVLWLSALNATACTARLRV